MTSVIKSRAFMLSPLQSLHFRLFRGASAIMRGATKTDLPENTSFRTHEPMRKPNRL